MKHLLLFFLFVASSVSAKTFLVNNGKSSYAIVLPVQATVHEQRAASILQEYIRKIAGAELNIVTDAHTTAEHEISVGFTNRIPASWKPDIDSLGEDGLLIRTYGKKLFLTGGTRKGSIYAVTHYLEKYLGCRKYSPTAEFVPSASSIELKSIHDMQVPPGLIRVVNGPFGENEDYRDWRRLTSLSDHWHDGSWRGYFVHTFDRLMPPGEYFGTHPEYYSFINGKRIPYGQLCLSNPDIFPIVIKKLHEEMAAHPSIKYWSVSQNDNYDACRCEACKKTDEEEGSPAGIMLRFVNKVAKEFPDKVITTLAYQYTRKPPLKTKPLPNVMVTLCSIELDRSQPIAATGGSFVEELMAWGRICDNLMIWDYEVQFTNYFGPFPLFHTLQPNIQLFNEYGAKAHFQQCNAATGTEFAELKTYLLSHLLWNDTVNADAVINDFMNGYYGAAGIHIRKYFDRLHKEEIATRQLLDIYGTPVSFANTLMTPELMQEYYGYFEKAEAAVKNQPEILERVKLAKMPLYYTQMEIGKTDLFGERGWFTNENGTYQIKPDMRAMIDTFHAVTARNKVQKMNERKLTPEDYYRSTLRFIDVSTEGNFAFKKTVTLSLPPAEKYSALGPGTLTNGVRGTENYKINWLGWQGKDVIVTVDLHDTSILQKVVISTLQEAKSWIIHPRSITCSISLDGITFEKTGEVNVEPVEPSPDSEEWTRDHVFVLEGKKVRYLRFELTATKTLPAWHHYAGEPSWLFVDEVVAR